MIKRKIIILISIIILASPAAATATGLGFDFEELFSELELAAGEGNNANTVIIENNASASANSGNNKAASGEVVEGRAEAGGSVKTIINGQVVEDTTVQDEGQGKAGVEIKSEVKSGDNKAEVKTEINTNGQALESRKSVDMDSSSPGAETAGQKPDAGSGDSAAQKDMNMEKQEKENSGQAAVNAPVCDLENNQCQNNAEQYPQDSGRKSVLARIWQALINGLSSGWQSIFKYFA